LHQPHANELFEKILNPIVVTNNLSVKSSASHSWDAPKHYQQRLARLLCFGHSFGKIVVNPPSSRQHIRAIIDHLAVAAFGAGKREARQQNQ
jgi:hypothetical protein